MSDRNERACMNCGSYLHHEDDCKNETYSIEFSIDGLNKGQYNDWIKRLKDAGFKPVLKANKIKDEEHYDGRMGHDPTYG